VCIKGSFKASLQQSSTVLFFDNLRYLTMDVSHITDLLSNLGKNQVTLQINDNDFQETRVEAYYAKNVSKDIFAGLDDIAMMCNRAPTKTSRQKVSVEVVNTKPIKPTKTTKVTQPTSRITTPTYNLVYALACIRDTMLTLETNQDKILDITRQFSNTLKDYVAQCTAKKLNIEINDEKVSKDVLRQYLDMALESNANQMPMHHNQYDIIIKVSSRYLQKNIVVLQSNNLTNDVLAKEYLESNSNTTEYITIQRTMNDNKANFTLGDDTPCTTIDNICIQNAIMKLKQQEGFQENLKQQSVKDLRFIAKDIGIETVDTHTGKLYSKSDLKQLIEAQLRTHL
jgi:hypothetical protein